MSDPLDSIACLTKEQREEIQLLEMKACMALLDDQIVQLQQFKKFHSDLDRPKRLEEHSDQFDALMTSVAQSTRLARQLNARAFKTLYERGHHGGAQVN